MSHGVHLSCNIELHRVAVVDSWWNWPPPRIAVAVGCGRGAIGVALWLHCDWSGVVLGLPALGAESHNYHCHVLGLQICWVLA